MKVIVIGGSGMLGSDVVAELRSRSAEVVAPGSSEIDITDPESMAKVAMMREFNWCVNCAAYTSVDLAESEVQRATELNALGPGYLARACAVAGIKLLHVSTDFVFDGEASTPYTEDSAPNPLGVYGRTKLEGEHAVLAGLPTSLILRTSWLFGANGKSFPRTIIGAWQAGKDLRVVSDQVGCPTYTADLARCIADAIEKDIFPGVYHASGPDPMSWHAFATLAVKAYCDVHGIESEASIRPIATEDWPTPAVRPKYSVLSNAKLKEAGIQPMRPIREALTEFVGRLKD
jgi:dTDP-4-dehydrorhamnose reductase